MDESMAWVYYVDLIHLMMLMYLTKIQRRSWPFPTKLILPFNLLLIDNHTILQWFPYVILHKRAESLKNCKSFISYEIPDFSFTSTSKDKAANGPSRNIGVILDPRS